MHQACQGSESQTYSKETSATCTPRSNSRQPSPFFYIPKLPLDGLGPLLASNVGQMGETLDVHPGLIIPVLDKVVELSVGGILGGDLLVETNMTALEKCHAILMVPDLLLHLYELSVRTENSAAKE